MNQNDSTSKPAMTLPVDRIISIKEPGMKILDVPLVKATEESLKGYATIVKSYEDAEVEIVTWPQQGWRPVVPGTGNEGGITEGEFVMEWVGNMAYGRNHAVDKFYVTGWFDDPINASESASNVDRSRIYVREANYHPDGSQIFYPKDNAEFIAVMALPGDDIKPEDFTAFYCDGSFGVNILPNVWHQPFYCLKEKAGFQDKQGKVHACIAVDFAEEFQTYLSVPLRAVE